MKIARWLKNLKIGMFKNDVEMDVIYRTIQKNNIKGFLYL